MVDGVPHQVTENQALLFHVLAEANGDPLTGPEIGVRAKVAGAFRADRYRNQIKSTQLKKLIPQPKGARSKFRLVLPPLAE
jgi:hypothetical protein